MFSAFVDDRPDGRLRLISTVPLGLASDVGGIEDALTPVFRLWQEAMNSFLPSPQVTGLQEEKDEEILL